jgi:hypothetical protein
MVILLHLQRNLQVFLAIHQPRIPVSLIATEYILIISLLQVFLLIFHVIVASRKAGNCKVGSFHPNHIPGLFSAVNLQLFSECHGRAGSKIGSCLAFLQPGGCANASVIQDYIVGQSPPNADGRLNIELDSSPPDQDQYQMTLP